MYAIETNALTKKFPRVEALHELSLKIEEGSVYALMGPNGAGKTTLIKLLMNIMSPTSGRATILGTDVASLQGRQFESIGYVSENQKMPEWMTVEAFLSYWRPFYPRWDRAFEQTIVKKFALPFKRKIKHLSRGMKMKASVTSALAFRPRLIVLDEPLSGLDPLVRDDLMETLVELAGETTVLFSSHDLAEIENFASHVGYLDSGRLVLSQGKAEVRQRYRRVNATGVERLHIPEHLPEDWREFAAEGSSARWIETAFNQERSEARAKELLGQIELSSSPLTLRDVFLTHARANRSVDPAGGRK